MSSLTSNKHAVIALFFASLIWGATPSIMKITLTVVPLGSLGFIRFGAAALLLFPFVFKRLHMKTNDVPLLVLASLFGITYNITFFFWGLKQTSALNAGIMQAIVPICTLLSAQLFLKEKITKKLLLGAGFGLVGLSFIIGRDIVQQGLTISPLGDFCLLLSTSCFVLYEITSKKLFKRYDALTITFYMFTIGALTFFPSAVNEYMRNPTWTMNLPFNVVFGIIYGIIGSSCFAYFLWNWGLSKMEVARVGFFFYLDPVIATIAAVLILHETISPFFLLGAFFIIFGLILAEGHLPYHRLHKR